MSNLGCDSDEIHSKRLMVVTLSRGADVLAQWNRPLNYPTEPVAEVLLRVKEQINTFLTNLIAGESSSHCLIDDKSAEYSTSDESEDGLYNLMETFINKGDKMMVNKSDNITRKQENFKRLKK